MVTVSRGVLVALLVSAACVACGGRSESRPDSSESTGSDAPNGNDDDDQATTGENPGASTSSEPNGDIPLGECVEGWPIYDGDCPWEGSDHLCYATKENACACLCPKDRNSTCLSGLPGGPDSHVAVSCF